MPWGGRFADPCFPSRLHCSASPRQQKEVGQEADEMPDADWPWFVNNLRVCVWYKGWSTLKKPAAAKFQ